MTAYSDATLLGWLASKPEKLERHLDKHPEDIDRLEQLTALADHQIAAMEHTVSAPDDIAERVISRMKLDPQLKEAGSVFADMMTIGFRTLRVVFGAADDMDDEADDETDDETDDGSVDERTDGNEGGSDR